MATIDIEISPKELEVLDLVGAGFTNVQIAQQLRVSVRTIETRRNRLLTKTNTHNTATLIKYAVKNNLIS